jgi:hypothetical protein
MALLPPIDRLFPGFATAAAAAFISALVISAQFASAATEEGLFAARGIGAQQCAVLNETLTGADAPAARDGLSNWVSGYLSHANRAGADTFDIMPIQDHSALSGFIENICRSNPDALVETVLASMIENFGPGNSATSSDLITLTAGEYSTSVRAEVFLLVQEALVTRGLLDAKAADGQSGPQTVTALQSVQKEAGLTETGLPDPATLFILFTEK